LFGIEVAALQYSVPEYMISTLSVQQRLHDGAGRVFVKEMANYLRKRSPFLHPNFPHHLQGQGFDPLRAQSEIPRNCYRQ
jgi:hypothetical protein